MKPFLSFIFGVFRLSPPARGAWIETAKEFTGIQIGKVAPRAGGVD